MRAQKSLANVSRVERGSSSSSAASGSRSHEHEAMIAEDFAEPEQILQTADYVEARGILLPAVEFLERAVNAARYQGRITGHLLCTVCNFLSVSFIN
jgi:hypothetical protein